MLELTRVTLSPQVALPVHETLGAELLAVESGSAVVDLVVGDGGCSLEEGCISQEDTAAARQLGPRPAISPGGSAVLQPGASAGVRHADDEPLVLLLLTLEPESDLR